MPSGPYAQFVLDLEKLILQGKSLPVGWAAAEGSAPTASGESAPVALLLTPHPDDECIIGALPLRLMREAGMRVMNIPVTLGSNRERRHARWQELVQSCNRLGFQFDTLVPDGLERINPATRTSDPSYWKSAINVVAAALEHRHPKVLFFPHEADANSTHIGTHRLAMDALELQPANFECFVVETEFWAPNPSANLMIESSAQDAASLVSALACHAGEVERNPYHLRLPAWMIDNVRRGAELAGSQGGLAPEFVFATLYRLRRWKNGRLDDFFTRARRVAASQSVQTIFTGENGA